MVQKKAHSGLEEILESIQGKVLPSPILQQKSPPLIKGRI